MRRDSTIAWLAAGSHAAAAAAMLFLLRPGLPGSSDAERLAYMTAHRLAWLSGWISWQIAAVLLVAFYAVLLLRFRGPLSITAMGAATAGLAIDIACEAQYMAVLPERSGASFAALDRELGVLIGYGANGLYTVAFALLVVAGRHALPKSTLVLAVPVSASGIALSLASLLHDARAQTAASAILFPLLTLWIALVAVWLRRSDPADLPA